MDENKTLQLVQDIADLLERIAAGPTHTPALYSTFLKVLITAQPVNQDSPRDDPSHHRSEQPGNETAHNQNGTDNSLGFLGSHFDSLNSSIDAFQSNSEMGPVVDMSTFPPTMAPNNPQEDTSGMLSMDSILSTGFWDSVLVPGSWYASFNDAEKLINYFRLIGYSNSLEGLSGGFVYGAGGSGLITPRITTPHGSGSNTPVTGHRMTPISEGSINAAFEGRPPEAEKSEL